MILKKSKSHGVQLLVRAVVRDLDGKVISDTGQKPSKSFVIQFLEFIKAAFDAVTTAATDKTGTERTIYRSTYAPYNSFQLYSAANEYINGIVVGTGDTAVTNTDYRLVNQLEEGATAGKITHGISSFGSPAVVGANVDMNITRSFTNNTGSTITVKEAGIYVKSYYLAWYSFCIIRDVIGPILVPDKCSLTVIYTYRTTV